MLFYTPQEEIIFQHRAVNKDTYPDLLGATVGGHVEIGSDFEDTVIKETREETGIRVKKEELIFLKRLRTSSYDRITDTKDNTMRAVFTYCYSGKVEDLVVEKGESLGFEVWPIDKLFSLFKIDRERFVPLLLTDAYQEIFRQVRELI